MVVGIVGIILGGVFPGIIDVKLTDAITTMTTITKRDTPADGLLGPKTEPYAALSVAAEQTYLYYFYNYTNPNEVLKGEKPIIQEVKVEFTKQKRKYDIQLNDQDDTVSYRSYSWFTPKNPSDWNLTIDTVNPVYFGGIAKASKEQYLQLMFTPDILKQFDNKLKADVVSMAQVMALPLYMDGLKTKLESAGIKEVVAKWGSGSSFSALVNGTITYMLAGNYTINSPDILKLQELESFAQDFQLQAALFNAQVLPYLWNTSSPVSLTNPLTTIPLWLSAAKKNETAVSALSALLMKYGYTNSNLTDPNGDLYKDMATISTWLISKFQPAPGDNLFFQVVKMGMVAKFAGSDLLTLINQCQNFTDMALMQFSGGLITRIAGLGNSVGTLINQPAFEFYAWQQTNAAATKYQLDLAQTKAFMAVFTNSANMAPFLSVLAEGSAALDGGDLIGFVQKFEASIYKAAGVFELEPERAKVFFEYMAVFLPETFYSSKLRSMNTGFFTRRTVHELLHGWKDAFGGGSAFPGFEGAQAIAEQAPTNTSRKLPTVYYRGTNDAKKIGVFQQDMGVKKFWNMTDLDLSCPNPALYAADAEAGKCHVWGQEEVIDGKQDALTLPPLGKIENPLKSYLAYVAPLKRNVWLDYSENIKYQGIDMQRYKLRASSLLSTKAHPELPDDVKTFQNNYRVTEDGFTDISTTMNMLPAFLGVPRHYTNLVEAAKFTGLTPTDWQKWEVADLETVIDIEPTAGKAMFGRQRLQFNLKADKKQLNGFYKSIWFGGENSNHSFYPCWWAEDGDQIKADQAKTFVDQVYGAKNLGATLQAVLIAVGAILLLVGGVLFYFYGFSARGGGANKGQGVQMF